MTGFVFQYYIQGVVQGIIIGCVLMILLFVYFFLIKKEYPKFKTSSPMRHLNKSNDSNNTHLHENSMTSDELCKLQEAIQHIHNVDNTFRFLIDHPKTFGFDEINLSKKTNANRKNELKYHIISRSMNHDIDEIENDYNNAIKDIRERSKAMKLMSQFISDIAKTHFSISKEMHKLSTQASNNSNRSNGSGLFGSSTSSHNQNHHEVKEETLTDAVWISLTKYYEEVAEDHDALADRLNSTFVATFLKIHESLGNVEKRATGEGARLIMQYRDVVLQRDKLLKKKRDKVDLHLDKLIQEETNRVDTLFQDVCQYVPKIIRGCAKASARSIVDTKNCLLNATKILSMNCRRINSMTNDLSSMLIKTTLRNSNKDIDCSSIPNLVSFLVEYLELSASTSTDSSLLSIEAKDSTNSQVNTKLNMSSHATGLLAASPPLEFLSKLPSQFANCIDTETGIWFNAFSGRLYRDIARSENFRTWFCSKLAYLLNRGQRPDYIDDFRVDSVSFGSTPPVVSNIRWVPLFASSNNKSTNQKSKKEMEDMLKSVDVNFLGELDDPDYDISCTADVEFKSGIRFALSTRIWINFPSLHYASIPITLTLDIREVSGHCQFGVRKDCTFISFLEEPQTRIEVKVAVGSDQFKIHDIPMVSEYIMGKIRKFIRSKFVYPNAHRMKLLWPRSWWPAGTEHLWIPTGPQISETISLDSPVEASTNNTNTNTNTNSNSYNNVSETVISTTEVSVDPHDLVMESTTIEAKRSTSTTGSQPQRHSSLKMTDKLQNWLHRNIKKADVRQQRSSSDPMSAWLDTTNAEDGNNVTNIYGHELDQLKQALEMSLEDTDRTSISSNHYPHMLNSDTLDENHEHDSSHRLSLSSNTTATEILNANQELSQTSTTSEVASKWLSSISGLTKKKS